MARALIQAVTPWPLLEGGEITGKYSTAAAEPRRSSSADPGNLALGEVVKTVAEEIGRTPSQVTINWSGRSRMPTTRRSSRSSARAPRRSRWTISAAWTSSFARSTCNASAPPARSSSPQVPRSFLESDHVRGLIFGSTFSQLDNHRQ